MYGLPLSRSINDFPWGLVCAREMDGCERVRGKVGVRKTGGSVRVCLDLLVFFMNHTIAKGVVLLLCWDRTKDMAILSGEKQTPLVVDGCDMVQVGD
ncbi:hypothetical protein V6N11_019400 [Hibiscus sabdariffa]|uniref:Uncharacterized protein n=2 Tax=Hibiscus sabdariffa TaxID=183260 RepID=A0ABR1ZYE8_9ROSI